MLFLSNDEPSLIDGLGRTPYVKALASILTTAETPLVVGIYGPWGSGKTSLLRQIQSAMNLDSGIATVWFDPWQHQFDEHPAIGLLQAVYSDLSGATSTEKRGQMRQLIKAIAFALAKGATNHIPVAGEFIVKTAEQAKAFNDEMKNHQQEEDFQKRELQQSLREAFSEFVKGTLDGTKAQDGDGSMRLAVFIDDLDRCVPERVVRLLESLKLFLNVPGCIYVLGLDRNPVEAAIEKEYSWASSSQAEYLDKIIQLQFTLPPVLNSAREAFVRRQLSSVFSDTPATQSPVQAAVVRLLAAGTSGNPRQMKRIVSGFGLMHLLGSSLIPDYRAEILALTILIQQKSEILFRTLSLQPERFSELFQERSDGSGDSLYALYASNDVEFSRLVSMAKDLAVADIQPYIHLAMPPDSNREDLYIGDVLRRHKVWVDSDGSDGEQAVLDGAALEGIRLSKAELRGADMVGAMLVRTDFSDSDLTEVRLARSRIVEVRLTRANLTRTQFNEAELSLVDFTFCNIHGADFSDSKIVQANLKSASIDSSQWVGARIENCNFSETHITRTDFSQSVRMDGKFNNARLFDCDFDGIDGRASSFSNVVLYACSAFRANLEKISLQGSYIELCNFGQARLRKSDLSRSVLEACDFRMADLKDADLAMCTMRSADLTESNLDGANLRGIDLQDCILRGALLTGTDLTGADIRGADLSGATLSGAILEGTLVDDVISDEDTIWPSSMQHVILLGPEGNSATH